MGVDGKTEGVRDREGCLQLQHRREAEHSSTLAEGAEMEFGGQELNSRH